LRHKFIIAATTAPRQSALQILNKYEKQQEIGDVKSRNLKKSWYLFELFLTVFQHPALIPDASSRYY